jgi:hypothetical protein
MTLLRPNLEGSLLGFYESPECVHLEWGLCPLDAVRARRAIFCTILFEFSALVD